MDLIESDNCLVCDYSMTGLPPGLPCPECGFSQNYSVEQPRAEEWFLSSDARVPVNVPFAAFMLLHSPTVHQTARRRFYRGILLPLLIATCLIVGLSSLGSVVTFERWRENLVQPGLHLDPDFVSNRLSALSGNAVGDEVHLPIALHMDEAWHAAPSVSRLILQTPRVAAIDLLGFVWYLLLALSGLVAACANCHNEAHHLRRRMRWPTTKTNSYVVMGFYARPFVVGLCFSLLALTLQAAHELRLVSAIPKETTLLLNLLGITVFLIWGGSVASRIGIPRRASRFGLSPALIWLVRTILYSILFVLISILFLSIPISLALNR